MDPALSSQAPTNEFGYCPRTPIYNVVNERPQISIEVREVCCGQSQSSPPTRKKSRFFDTLRLKSPRKVNVADENGSPQSLKKRKSIADIFPFSSTRSRKPPDSDHIYHSFRTKRSRTASPSKQRAVLSMVAALFLRVSVLMWCRRCFVLPIEPTKESRRDMGLYL
jgi:hypothetical protein